MPSKYFRITIAFLFLLNFPTVCFGVHTHFGGKRVHECYVKEFDQACEAAKKGKHVEVAGVTPFFSATNPNDDTGGIEGRIRKLAEYGAKVRLLVDKKSHRYSQKLIDQLNAKDSVNITINYHSYDQHDKFVVFTYGGQRVALYGSYNLTRNGGRNEEIVSRYYDAAVVGELKKYFERALQDAKAQKTPPRSRCAALQHTPQKKGSHFLPSSEVNLFESYIERIKHAKKGSTLVISTFTCRPTRELIDALKGARKKGVAVKIVVDGRHCSRVVLHELKDAGASVVGKRHGAGLHHSKFLLRFHPDYPDNNVLILGSSNLVSDNQNQNSACIHTQVSSEYVEQIMTNFADTTREYKNPSNFSPRVDAKARRNGQRCIQKIRRMGRKKNGQRYVMDNNYDAVVKQLSF